MRKRKRQPTPPPNNPWANAEYNPNLEPDEFDRWFIESVAEERKKEAEMEKNFEVGEGVEEVLGD